MMRHILLDSCVLSASQNKEENLAKAVSVYIDDLDKSGNSLYVSELSYYELLRGAGQKKKIKLANSLGKLRKAPVTQERIQRATQLYSAYLKHPSTKSILGSISDIDVFIGSLLFTEQKPLLLTADFNDFPRPFFNEKEVAKIEYKRGRGQLHCQYFYLLEANLEALFGGKLLV